MKNTNQRPPSFWERYSASKASEVTAADLVHALAVLHDHKFRVTPNRSPVAKAVSAAIGQPPHPSDRFF